MWAGFVTIPRIPSALAQMSDVELPSYQDFADPMRYNSMRAIQTFLQDLPKSAEEVAETDRSWLIEQILHPDMIPMVSTKAVATISEQLGTTAIMKPSIFLPKIAYTLAIHWELDHMLPEEVGQDPLQAQWLKTLAGKDSQHAPAEEEPFRWVTPLRPLPTAFKRIVEADVEVFTPSQHHHCIFFFSLSSTRERVCCCTFPTTKVWARLPPTIAAIPLPMTAFSYRFTTCMDNSPPAFYSWMDNSVT